MTDFGFPMGPFVLIDMAGIDILVKTDDVMCKAFPRHGRLSPVARRLVAEGHHGQKTGAGVYRYEKGKRRPLPSDATAAVLDAARCETGRPARAIDAGEITERLALRMVAEAFHVLAEGIAQRESDIDAATVLGLGFPGFRGGVLRYARDLGKAAVRSRLEALETRFGARFALPGPFQHDKGE
jgi:3-hydroxyacyl-CoA dehydrogenase